MAERKNGGGYRAEGAPHAVPLIGRRVMYRRADVEKWLEDAMTALVPAVILYPY